MSDGAVPYEVGLLEDLADPEEAAAYLNAALKDGDQEVFLLALRHITAAGGMSQVAWQARLNADDVEDDLATFRAFERSIVLDKIDEQLIYEPARETRNKKPLIGLIPPWHYTEPVWELRGGDYRVFYDVNDDELTVTARAIRFKPPDKTTGDILW